MAVLASTIIDRVRSQLLDTGAVKRWTDGELLTYLSDGQRAIVAASASAANSVIVVNLTEGTRQGIPSNGYALLSVIRNIGDDMVTPGRAVRLVEREALDNQNPDWHSATATKVVQNYVYDPSDHTRFYVYPPNDGTGKLQINYARMPVDLVATSDVLTVQDIFQTPLFDYCMFRAHQKDSDFAAGQAAAAQYLQLFTTFMSAIAGAEAVETPNLALGGTQLTIKGAAK